MQIKTIEILKLLDCLNNVMVETSSHSFYESSITKIVPISYYFIKARLLSIKFAIQLKKWCVVNLTNRWLPIVYKQFIEVSRNSALFFNQSTSSYNTICNTTKETIWSELRTLVMIKCYTIKYHLKHILVFLWMKKCFWTPFCFFQKRHNNILW